MKLESTNITLIVLDYGKKAPVFIVRREHLEELRDLINDYLEMERKGKL